MCVCEITFFVHTTNVGYLVDLATCRIVQVRTPKSEAVAVSQQQWRSEIKFCRHLGRGVQLV